MANEHIGFLPFGSSNSSVIFQDALTDKATLEAKSGVTVAGTASSEFDSVLGMRPRGPTGDLTDFPEGDGSYGYLLTTITDYATLQSEGQMTFEVETKAIATLDAANGSNGYDTTSRTSAPAFVCVRGSGSNYFAFAATKGSTVKRLVMQDQNSQTAGALYYDNFPQGSTAGTYINESGKGQFSRVDIAWHKSGTGFYTIFAINGVIFEQKMMSSVALTDPFNRIYIGSLVASPQFVAPWWFRNFQLSNRAPAFARPKKLGKTVLWSDSLFEDTLMETAANYMDNVTAGAYRRGMATKFPRVGQVTVDVDNSHSMLGGDPFSGDVGNVTALHPQVVVFMGGTNDIINGASLVTATWITEYKSVMSTLFNAGVETVICCTIPTLKYNTTYNTEAHVVKLAECNAEIEALSAWAAISHPGKNLYVADVFKAFGGEGALANKFRGGFTGANDDLHWHALGHIAAGTEIANTVLENMLT